MRRAICEYGAHYHQERNQQGVGDCLVKSAAEAQLPHGPVGCRKRLGGPLKFYCRRAA